MTQSTLSHLLIAMSVSALAAACSGNRDSLTAPSPLDGSTAQNDHSGNPPASSASREANGEVAGLSGTCPSLRFTVGTQAVTTTAATAFVDGRCGDVAAGRRVEVSGVAQGNVLSASRVELRGKANDDNDPNHNGDDDGGNATEVRGSVANRNGACPALSFTVGATSVRTTASTRFDNVSCSAVVNGVPVEVKGAVQSGALVATRVEPR